MEACATSFGTCKQCSPCEGINSDEHQDINEGTCILWTAGHQPKLMTTHGKKMKTCNFILACIVSSSLSAASVAEAVSSGRSPVNVVYDTDIEYDVDDTLGLAVAHALQARGEINIAAVTITGDTKLGPPFVDLINRFYGHPAIPIGFSYSPMTWREFVLDHLHFAATSSLSLDFLSVPVSHPRNFLGADSPDKMISANVPPAAAVLRASLAAQPDSSVIINGQGNYTNIAALLESKPDRVSALTGRQLIERKVRTLVLVGGVFDEQTAKKINAEMNVDMNRAAARTILESWPTDVVWLGAEVGPDNLAPAANMTTDYNYVPAHPIVEAHQLFRYSLNSKEPQGKSYTAAWPYDRPTWASAAVLFIARPDRGYFDLSEPGTVVLPKTGHPQFTPASHGRHRYLKWDEKMKLRALEAILLLASQPPATAQ